MGVIDLAPYKPVPSTMGDANQVAGGFTVIQALLNGNVDNNNFGAGLIFDPAKIMQAAAIDGDPLVWDNTLGKWKPASLMAAGRPRAPRVVVSTMAGGPPASPVDQDIWIATAVDTNGTRWAFQYSAGSASAYKWEFIGGNEAFVRPSIPNYTSAVNAFVFTNTGLIVARAGDYKVKLQGYFQNNGASTPAFVGLRAGVAGVGVQVQLAGMLLENGGNVASLISEDVINLGAANNIQFCMNATGQPWTVGNAIASVLPVRIA